MYKKTLKNKTVTVSTSLHVAPMMTSDILSTKWKNGLEM